MELRELQLDELEILLEFKRICEENNLRYFLQAGTLLGAVRHHGFIPWDDDIDVSMPKEDYERLAKICPKALGSGYFFQDGYTDSNYPFYFSKIRRNGTEVDEEYLRSVDMHKGRYIDIFPLDYCPEGDSAARVYFKLVTMMSCAYMTKVNSDAVEYYTKPAARLMLRMLVRLPIGVIRSLRDGIAGIPARLGCRKRLCTVGGTHGYPAETYKAEWFAGTQKMTFEGISFDAPSGWDKILGQMYGEYMTPVGEDGRRGHFKRT